MNNTISISILGDICPTRDFQALFDSEDPIKVFGQIADNLKNSDISIANLEAPITASTSPIKKCGPNLKAEPRDIIIFKNAGIKVLSLANNHILDYGEKAVIETINICRNNSIATVGAGRDKKEAQEPYLFSKGNKVVGVFSAAEAEFNVAGVKSAGANHFDPYDSIDTIRSIRDNCDYLILLFHGGAEHYVFPSPMLQKRCRKMADAGADIIICQHSHCIGTMENYNNSTIIYGQGNAVFGYNKRNERWNEGLLIEVMLENKEKQLKFRLINASKDGVDFAEKNKSCQRIEEFKRISAALNNPELISKMWNTFCTSKSSHYLPLLYGKCRIFTKLNRLFNNYLIDILYPRNKKLITMNLLRCETHHEILVTILEELLSERKD